MMVFMSKRMLSCDEAAFLMSRSYEDKLSFKEKFNLRIHIITCYLCRRYEKQLAQLNRIIHQYKEGCGRYECQHHLEPEVKEQMAIHVNKELNKGA